VIYDTYMALSSREKPLFHKKTSFMTPFLLNSYFRTHPTTLLLKILGGLMLGPPRPQNFWSDGPPAPL